MIRVTEELGIKPFIDDQDRGVTDDEDVEDQEGMERHGGNEAYSGPIVKVWTKYGRYYYPGKSVDAENIPDSIHKKLTTTAEKYIIHWHGKNKYSAIYKHNVELLGENQTDKVRAEKSPSIHKNYHLTFSDSAEEE